MTIPVCHEHSGCLKDIANLYVCVDHQAKAIRHMEERMNSIMGKLNVILGGIVVACVLLLINIAIKTV